MTLVQDGQPDGIQQLGLFGDAAYFTGQAVASVGEIHVWSGRQGSDRGDDTAAAGGCPVTSSARCRASSTRPPATEPRDGRAGDARGRADFDAVHEDAVDAEEASFEAAARPRH